MRPIEDVNIPNKKSFLYIFILTTNINSIMRSFFLNKKNVEIPKIFKLLKNDLVVLNETD